MELLFIKKFQKIIKILLSTRTEKIYVKMNQKLFFELFENAFRMNYRCFYDRELIDEDTDCACANSRCCRAYRLLISSN